MNLYNDVLTKKEVLERIGDIAQLGGIKSQVITNGKANGVRTLEVNNGSGLRFTVLADRALDIATLSYKGVPISFISKSGITSPFLGTPSAQDFTKGFYGGFLTTCGMRNTGPEGMYEGEKIEFHGGLTNMPSELTRVEGEWVGDDYEMTISGIMKDSKLFGHNLTLYRTIKTTMGSNKLDLVDRYVNDGFKPQPLVLLYHYNYGYPFIDVSTVLNHSEARTWARDEEAQKGIDEYRHFEKPTMDFKEQVFFHDFKNSEVQNGNCFVEITNTKLLEEGLTVHMNYCIDEFEYTTQWKQLGQGDYALAIEPCNSLPLGIEELDKRDELPMLASMEERTFHMEIEFIG